MIGTHESYSPTGGTTSVEVTQGIPPAANTTFPASSVLPDGDLLPSQAPDSSRLTSSSSDVLMYVTSSLLLVLGVVGNLLALVVFCKRRQRSSFRVLLQTLCVVDSVCVVLDESNWLMATSTSRQMSMFSVFGCDVGAFLSQFPRNVSSWLLVTVTVERTIAVSLPYHAKKLCTTRNALIVIAVMVVTQVGLCAFHFGKFTWSASSCMVRHPADKPYMDARAWVFLLFYSAIPTPVLIALNCVLIYHLQRHQQVAPSATFSSSASSMQQRRLTVMAVLLTVFFILCTLPYTLVLLIQKVISSRTVPRAVSSFAKQLSVLNHATNWVLYCCTSRQFRTDLKSLVTCRHIKVTPTTSLQPAVTHMGQNGPGLAE